MVQCSSEKAPEESAEVSSVYPGETFTARVRHIITGINNIEDLKPHWDRFMDD
ncbi:MAG: hypothetical protein ABFS38_06200 [Bacteroidota bacterium]